MAGRQGRTKMKERLSAAEKRRKASEERAEAKRKYLQVKKNILMKEEKNYTKLCVIKAENGGWWKMFDHSALMYYYEIREKINGSQNLCVDKDYCREDERAKYGVVNIQNIEKFSERLKEAKIKKSYERNGVIIFELGRAVDKETMVKYYHIEEERWEKVNQVVMPKETIPMLKAKMKGLAVTTHELVRKLDGVARQNYGDDLEKIAVGMLEDCYLIAMGDKNRVETIMEFDRKLRLMNAKIAVLTDLRLIMPKKIYQIMDDISKAQAKVKEEMKEKK